MNVEVPALSGVGSELGRVLFDPESVALVGASDDRTKTGGRPLAFLREAEWQGRLYPVNPRRDTVLGERSWPSLKSLPEVPEHVFVLTGSDLAVSAVRECAELGVAAVTIMASGFGEAGPVGLARQAEVQRIVEQSSLRVVGPSSLGIVNVASGFKLTANAAFGESGILAGDLFVASHSGSVIGALVSRGKALGIGFAGLVSTGGEVDLSLGEICSTTLDDPSVGAYALFLETLRGADDLRRFAIAAAERGKPVMAYKLGRTHEAAALSVSHTGALAGDDAVASMFLADLGIGRVDTFEALLEGQNLAKSVAISKLTGSAPRVCVVTTTGGGGAMVIDQLGMSGMVLQKPSSQTAQQLADAGIDTTDSALVDLGLEGTRYEVMKNALDILQKAPEFDVVVAVPGSSARHQPHLVVRPIAESVGTGTPVVAFIVPDAPDAHLLLQRAGVASFRTPEACVDSIAATFARRPPRSEAYVPPSHSVTELLDEYASYDVLDALGVPRAPCVVVKDESSVTEPPFDGPMVVKVISADLPHKSDIGGVITGIDGLDGVKLAIAEIGQSISRERPDARRSGYLVQPMVASLTEVLIGYRIDAEAGPLVILAAGGVGAELYEDRVLRSAPVTRGIALEMIEQITALKMVSGYRGSTRGDLEALADAIVSLSQAASAKHADVVEAEVNPLLVLAEGHGVVAVDALVTLGRNES